MVSTCMQEKEDRPVGRFVTFGEIMMRLNPEGYNRFVQAERFEASYAGGEANVAVSLANYGLETSNKERMFRLCKRRR